MTVLLLTLAIFGVAMAIMAVGVVFSGKCLRGSCGGSEEIIGPDGEPIRCASCPRRKEDEARRRAPQMQMAADEDDDEDGELMRPVAIARFEHDRR